MGGPGSGNWYRWGSKTTVEQCLALDVNKLAKDGFLRVGTAGELHWAGENLFGCRHCWGLSYTSCQEAHQLERLFSLERLERLEARLDRLIARLDKRQSSSFGAARGATTSHLRPV